MKRRPLVLALAAVLVVGIAFGLWLLTRSRGQSEYVDDPLEDDMSDPSVWKRSDAGR